jgi:hypothetical protein
MSMYTLYFIILLVHSLFSDASSVTRLNSADEKVTGE